MAAAGTDESLSAYLARCERQSLPGSRGRVVFSKSGSRLYQTGPFRPGKFKLYISGSRDWTVRVRDGG